ncbi:hypothetical protein JCM15519_25950 [Fundidesulfovibrio butyratiphilus]
MTLTRKCLFFCCLILGNLALFGLMEWGASVVVGHFGLKQSETRIFNAKNGRDDRFIVQYDERLGYRLVSKNRDISKFEDSTGRTFSRQKPDNVYRIVCLGGSTTYGVGADKTNAFPWILEDLLALVYTRCGLRFEVLNVGVMGYHSWHSRIRLKEELLALRPDLVLTMDAVNDLVCSTVVEDSLAFIQEKQRLLGLTNARGEPSLLARGDAFLGKHLNLYVLLKYLGVKLAQPKISPTDMAAKIKAFGYQDNVTTMARECREHQTDFGIINYPWLATPHPGPEAAEVLRQASTPLYLFGKLWFPKANAAVAGETGATHINPQPVFDAWLAKTPDRAGELYFDDIHFTKLGNLLLAREVFKGLAQVPSFRRFTSGCPVSDPAVALANAVKLQAPRIHFTNGWPRSGETPCPLKLVRTENLGVKSPDDSGRQFLRPARTDQPGLAFFTATAAVSSAPMRYTLHTAFFFPRVSGPSDRVEVLVNGKDVFSLRGMQSGQWTGLSDRFGLYLPALAPGAEVTVRLSGKAQVWLVGGDLIFGHDETFPGL